MTRVRMLHMLTATVAAAVLTVSGTALAANGDCSQPVSSGSNPTASDCLFILKAAIGAAQCTPDDCVCRPTGGARVTATDALMCLKKAVGQNVTLNCPCNPPSLAKCSSATLVSVAGAKLDSGWNGIAHDTDLIEGAEITLEIVRRCSTDSSVCKTDADCPGGTCDLTCDCDSQTDTVCEVSGPTHQQRCLVTLAPCSTNADCNSNQCVRFFGPPLGLSAGGTPACVTSFFALPITGTADSKTGTGVFSSFLRSRVHIGVTRDAPCPRCGPPSQNPKIGDTFTCESGPNEGNPCTVDAVSPDFGGASNDCPPDATANVSGIGLAVRFNEVSTATVSEQALIPCGGQNALLHPDNGGGFCLDDFSTCSTNADCKRCKSDLSTCTTNTDCTGGAGDECASAPDVPISCGLYCHCGYCAGDPDQPCFNDGDCTAPDTCVPGDGSVVLQQAVANGCSSLVCGTVNKEECCSADNASKCLTDPFNPPNKMVTNQIGECSLAPYEPCDNVELFCGAGEGTCVFKNKPCFENVISRTGTPSALGSYCVNDPAVGACTTNADCGVGNCVPDTSEPTAVALFCLPPTSSSSINNAGGIPGPGAIRFKSVVFTCRCGDGTVGCDEQCDDGNLVNGDGCDQACRVEP